MNTSKRIALMTALGLWSAAAASLQAQTFSVDVKWTMQQQDLSTFNNGVYNDKVKTTKLTSVDLLDLLASSYSTNFPDGFPFGATLVLVDYDHFQVQDGTGGILLTNVSDFLTYSDTYAQTNFLYAGKENTITGTRSYLFTYRATIEYTDLSSNAVSFSYTGTMMERYSRAALDQNGNRLNQSSLLLNGSGTGTNSDGFFILSGTVKMPVSKWLE
jgi:hypothetical protein